MELGTGDIVSLLREIHRGNEENPFKDIASSSDFAEIYLFSTMTFNINSFLWKRLIVD